MSIDKEKNPIVLSLLEKKSLFGDERRWLQVVKYTGVSVEERSKKGKTVKLKPHPFYMYCINQGRALIT